MSILPDDEIEKMISDVIKCKGFVIMLFKRDHRCFGNIFLVIANYEQEFKFVTDRDDIFCNSKLIISHGYHVAGIDDCPTYLIKAIKEVLNIS